MTNSGASLPIRLFRQLCKAAPQNEASKTAVPELVPLGMFKIAGMWFKLQSQLLVSSIPGTLVALLSVWKLETKVKCFKADF